MINWKELRITDADGCEWEDNLGELVEADPGTVAKATVENGRIVAWDGFFLSVSGEEPDWDTPRVPVDWTGFEDAVVKSWRLAAGHGEDGEMITITIGKNHDEVVVRGNVTWTDEGDDEMLELINHVARELAAVHGWMVDSKTALYEYRERIGEAK